MAYFMIDFLRIFSYILVMQSFADQMRARNAIRHERRPLPVHDLDGNHRQAAATVLRAEMKHASTISGAQSTPTAQACCRPLSARARGPSFRFDHEVRAREAYAWLSDLNMHEADKTPVGNLDALQRGATRGLAGTLFSWRAASYGACRPTKRRRRRVMPPDVARPRDQLARRSTSTSGWKGLSSLGVRMSIGR